MALSNSQFEQYQRDGYVVVEDLLSAAEVERVRSRIHEYAAGERTETAFERMLEPDVDPGEFGREVEPVRKFEGVGMAREDEVFADLARHKGILEIIEQLQGPNLKLLRSAAVS